MDHLDAFLDGLVADRRGIVKLQTKQAAHASPQDIANACLYLASPMASYVSGVNICVHGGG